MVPVVAPWTQFSRIGAGVITRMATLLALLLGSCGVPKPAPVVPPGEIGCDVACQHVSELVCGTGKRLCVELCEPTARNAPDYPTCLARAATCEGLNACDQ